MPRKRQRSHRGFYLSLILVGAIGVAIIGLRAISAAANRPADSAPDPATLMGVTVTGRSEAVEAILPPGGGVVIVLSTACPHCHDLMKRIARAADGHPLPRLRLVALEGVEAARILADTMNVVALLGGPRSGSAQFAKALDIVGTPTTFWVDSSGRVVRKLVGNLDQSEVIAVVQAARSSLPLQQQSDSVVVRESVGKRL